MDVSTTTDALPVLNTMLRPAVGPVREMDKSFRTEQPAEAPKDEEVQAAVKAVNDVLKHRQSQLQFETDQDSGRMIVKLIDSETRKVLRQMPSEEMLAIGRSLDRARGALIHGVA